MSRALPQAASPTLFPLTAGSSPFALCAGPDGNVWFTEGGTNKIGRITPAGVITEFPVPTAGANPQYITTGPDGNLWFTENAARVGRITPSGTVTEYAVAIGKTQRGSSPVPMALFGPPHSALRPS